MKSYAGSKRPVQTVKRQEVPATPHNQNQSLMGGLVSSAVAGVGIGAGSEIGHRMVGSLFNSGNDKKAPEPSATFGETNQCEIITNILKKCQEGVNNDCSYLFNQLLENGCKI